MTAIPQFRPLQLSDQTPLPETIRFHSARFRDVANTIAPLRDAVVGIGAAVVNVQDPAYGAVADDRTDTTSALNNALTALLALGGGYLLIPPGPYVFSTLGGTVTLPVPVSSGFAAAPVAIQYHVYLHNVDNIVILMAGATFRSTITNGGEIILCNGVRNFTVVQPAFSSVATFDTPGTGVPIVAGMGAFAFTSTDRDSYGVSIEDGTFTNTYSGIYCFGDRASPYRVRGLRATYVQDGGDYMTALHNNGNDAVIRSQGTNVNARPFFIYGADTFDVTAVDLAGPKANTGFSALVKTYDANTVHGTVALRSYRNTTVPKLVIQSQHDPVTQPTPGVVEDLAIDFCDVGTTGPSIEFEYFQNAVLTATSSLPLFNNVRITGECVNDVTTTVTLTGVARCLLNVDGLQITAGALSILQGKGFFSTQLRSWVPVLAFNGSAVGITGTLRGEYVIVNGNQVMATADVVLTNKGALGAGNVATISLPWPSAAYATLAPVITGAGRSGMSGLNGPITGEIPAGSTTAALYIQGAAGWTAMDPTNCTNASSFKITMTYQM